MRILMSLILLSLASISSGNTVSVELVSPDGTNPYRAGGLEEVVVPLLYRVEPNQGTFGVGVSVFYSSQTSRIEIQNLLTENLFAYGDMEDLGDGDNDPLTDRRIRIVWLTFAGVISARDGDKLADLSVVPVASDLVRLNALVYETAPGFSAGQPSLLELDFSQSVGPTVSINSEESYECTMPNAGEVTVAASTTSNEEDPIASIQWFVDGSYAADGDSVTFDASLGTTRLEAIATTISGDTAQDATTINVIDTVPPMIAPEAIQTGGNSIGASLYEIATNVSDVCDPSPTVTSVMGLEIQDGAKARVLRKVEQVTLEGSGLTVHVDAVDSSGNTAAATIEVE